MFRWVKNPPSAFFDKQRVIYRANAQYVSPSTEILETELENTSNYKMTETIKPLKIKVSILALSFQNL